ncbi:MAG TPA: YdcF family protein, partial [Sporosarcina sp.]|nr:YdcF family protein [Sporosarcina sp.]
ILASLLMLERKFQLRNIKRILVVTNSFHMKRLDLTLRTYMPSWINFTLCPTQDGVTHRNNWHLSEKGRIRVLTEAEKIINYVKQGSIIDEKIDFTL